MEEVNVTPASRQQCSQLQQWRWRRYWLLLRCIQQWLTMLFNGLDNPQKLPLPVGASQPPSNLLGPTRVDLAETASRLVHCIAIAIIQPFHLINAESVPDDRRASDQANWLNGLWGRLSAAIVHYRHFIREWIYHNIDATFAQVTA